MEVGEENKRENKQIDALNPTPETNLFRNHFSSYPHLLASGFRISYRNSKNDQLSSVEIPLPTGFKKSDYNLNLV